MSELAIRVDNRVRIFGLQNEPKVIGDELRDLFEYDNPKFHELRRMGLPHWKEPRRLATWKDDSDHLSLPRGNGRSAVMLLQKRGYTLRVQDARVVGKSTGKPLTHRMTLREHQNAMVIVMEEREQCLVECGTGGGKTSAALGFVAKHNIPTLVVVPSKGLLRQWIKRADVEFGLKPKDVGIYQGKNRRLRPLTIGLQHTLRTHAADDVEALAYFGAVIADEVHLAAADQYYKAIDPFPAKYRIGTSDDHRRKDKKEFLIRDLFGVSGINISYDELVLRGAIMDVEMRLVPTEAEAPWYGMPNDEDDKEVDFVRLCKELATNQARLEKCVQIACDESAFGPVVILTHEVEHCRQIAEALQARGLCTGFLLGEDEDAFEETITALNSGAIHVGVGTYKAAGTGIDIPPMVALIAYTPIAANEQLTKQARGRVCRTCDGKPYARFYVFWDRKIYPAHRANLRRWHSRIFTEKNGRWEPC